ncbi:MAG: PD-(D/E)XK nuclease domain-containing protein, partial [Lachnospiraceae bacterium]|nr:PD-(D/E)XK nuclease domain-containing protein [Lachnospiraceae bacterium]
FLSIYQNIVISCTSYMDAKENAYHMLFLGMCITLRGAYKVTSNIEAGYGRSDITLEALVAGYPSMIVEFKQGEDIDGLKEAALQQIIENRYYTGLSGEVICVGIAHDKKRCSMTYKILML